MQISKGKWVNSHTLQSSINRGGGELIWNAPPTTTSHPTSKRERERRRERKEREKEEENREKKERESERAREFFQIRVSAFSQRYFEMLYSRYHA